MLAYPAMAIKESGRYFLVMKQWKTRSLPIIVTQANSIYMYIYILYIYIYIYIVYIYIVYMYILYYIYIMYIYVCIYYIMNNPNMLR